VLSGQTETGVNKESPDRMVRRVCRELGGKQNIIVLNDESPSLLSPQAGR